MGTGEAPCPLEDALYPITERALIDAQRFGKSRSRQ